MKRFFRSVLMMACVSSMYSIAQDKKEISFAVTEVAPGIHMLSGVGGFAGGNIGLSVGEDGVVMIDDSMPPMLDKMKEAIKSVTGKKVDFLINTHVHFDHIGNNAAMAEAGTHIVAHKNLRQHLKEKGMRDGSPAPESALPVITFSEAMTFHLNGEDAEVFHVATAHTDGDAVIKFKKANVIHAGDVFFHGLFPFIDLDSGGSVDGYIKAQKRILSVSDENTKIIPGHGPLATKKELERDLAVLEDCRNVIAKLVSEGKSEDDVVKLNPLKKYHDDFNWGFITTERMTRQLYKGLK